jgi:hypothetical protein
MIRWLFVTAVALAALISAPSARAVNVDIGYISYDVTSPGSTAEFDITNVTGANSIALADTFFPVTTAVTLSSLSLTVKYSDLSSHTFSSSYFSTALDGESFDGSTIAIGGANPLPVTATLTGVFSPLVLTLSTGGSPVTINPTFTASITDIGGDLNDGDLSLIVATIASTKTIPEPDTMLLLLIGASGLAVVRSGSLRRRAGALLTRRVSGTGIAAFVLALLGSAACPGSAEAIIITKATLTAAASPSSGVAGVTYVNLTAYGLPATGVVPTGMTITIAQTCAAGATSPVSGALTTLAYSIKSIAVTGAKRIQFQIPAAALQQTYFVSFTGLTSSSSPYASSNCALLAVTTSNKTLNACIPSSSLSVAFGSKVVAYVPNGAWDNNNTGVQAVPIEGGGSAVSIATPNAVNACSTNPATGQTVCTANNTDVYLITGTSLTSTLTSGSNNFAGFSGGECENCGVAINALTNTAYIEEGFSPSPSGSAIQVLSLGSTSPPVSPSFTPPLVLSPGEDDVYDLLELNGSGQIKSGGELSNSVATDGEFDSAAEDCTTGIALASLEFTQEVFIADLTQLTQPVTGTWTAPSQIVNFPEFTGFSAGTSGISVAPGASHLGIVTGEFGGSQFAVLQLPATSGSGTPAFADYAAAYMPNTPDGATFVQGDDPHTLTAYTSPNNGRAYGLMVGYSGGVPKYIGVIDLAELLAATRTASTHSVDPSVNLLATPSGGFGPIIKYIATGP